MDPPRSISALANLITVIFCLVIVRRGQLALYIISPVLIICLFGILSYSLSVVFHEVCTGLLHLFWNHLKLNQ